MIRPKYEGDAIQKIKILRLCNTIIRKKIVKNANYLLYMCSS